MIPEEVKREAERIKITKFRERDFINREKEIRYWKDVFFSVPYQIQFMYGPKSCGKTTLLEKIRDDIIADKKESKKIAFFWYDLRREVFGSYGDVIEFLFPEKNNLLKKAGSLIKG